MRGRLTMAMERAFRQAGPSPQCLISPTVNMTRLCGMPPSLLTMTFSTARRRFFFASISIPSCKRKGSGGIAEPGNQSTERKTQHNKNSQSINGGAATHQQRERGTINRGSSNQSTEERRPINGETSNQSTEGNTTNQQRRRQPVN